MLTCDVWRALRDVYAMCCVVCAAPAGSPSSASEARGLTVWHLCSNSKRGDSCTIGVVKTVPDMVRVQLP
jgi:hypothetical protein